MTEPNYKLIAHELGHVIYAYLYETKQYPVSMILKPEGNTAGCVEFEEYWTTLGTADGAVARIAGNSYLGGFFGELLWCNKVRVMGIRADLDELLTELRYIGKYGKYRRSRSKLFKELWTWFYTDTDKWSYGGMMKTWLDSPNNRGGTEMAASRVEKRLPEVWKLYCKFLEHINKEAFANSVLDIGARRNAIMYRQSLRMYGRRIIPDTVLHPADII
jgi:hypothetical protein